MAKYNKNLHIQVDGGVDKTNIKQIVEAGADVIVAGSAVFKNDEIEVTLININSEPQRMKKPDNDVGLIIDGKVYYDKN